MTLRELFGVVAPGKLASLAEPRATEALHDGDATDAPLLVRLFTAIGTWIGAAMVAVLFAALEIYEIVPLALVMAAGLFVAAILLARGAARSLARTQLIWAMTLGAQGLVIGALAELDADERSVAGCGLALELATLFLIRVPSLQLISTVCAVGFATWFTAELELPMYPLWVALPAAAIATAAWIFEVSWAARLGRTWSAIAYGLPIGVAGPLTLLSPFDEGMGLYADGMAATIATAAMLGLIALVLACAWREDHGAIEPRAHLLGVIAMLAVLAARHVPGLSLALLWLLIAHLRESKSLRILAQIQLAGFLFFFYYQLDTTLLLKSLWVISTGVVLLLGAGLARPREVDEPGRPRRERESRWLPALALVLLTSGMVIGASLAKQRIVDEGETLLLPLAPVDPRSLMQGDYMQLRYALEQELPGGLPRHGKLVITVDDRGVGHFARPDDGSPPAANERLLEYRLRERTGDRLRIGAEEFLFEEGSAELYAGARYGELALADDGEVVLIGLRDEELQPLGVRLHDR